LRPDVAVRPVTAEDTDEIVALYARAAATEPGIGPVPRAEWERFVRQPQNHNGRDFRVAQSGGRLAGLAESHLKYQSDQIVRFCKLVVDPACRRQGVGTALLINLMKIEPPSVILHFQSLASTEWTAGLEFLNAFDFRHVESDIGMRCTDLVSDHFDPPFPISIARITDPAGYGAHLAGIHNAAYRHDAAFRPFTTEAMSQAVDGDELWIACEDSQVVAFCHLELEPNLIWLESLAVLPDYQGNGLATALAHRSLRAVSVGADRPAALNVSNKNPRALALYSRLGFVPRREMRRFSASRSDVFGALARHGRICNF
jgi:ribosomal protein S18 acetylase RimI-like enzyme